MSSDDEGYLPQQKEQNEEQLSRPKEQFLPQKLVLVQTIGSIPTLEEMFNNKTNKRMFRTFIENIRDIFPWEFNEAKEFMNEWVLDHAEDEDNEAQRLLKAAMCVYEMATELRQASPGSPFRTREHILCSAEKHIRLCRKHFAWKYKTEIKSLLKFIHKVRHNLFNNNLNIKWVIPGSTPDWQRTHPGCTRPGGAGKAHYYHVRLLTSTEFVIPMVTPILTQQLRAFALFMRL